MTDHLRSKTTGTYGPVDLDGSTDSCRSFTTNRGTTISYTMSETGSLKVYDTGQTEGRYGGVLWIRQSERVERERESSRRSTVYRKSHRREGDLLVREGITGGVPKESLDTSLSTVGEGSQEGLKTSINTSSELFYRREIDDRVERKIPKQSLLRTT